VFILTDGKITRRSDQIEFVVPEKMDKQIGTVINIIDEPIPPNLLGLSALIFYLLIYYISCLQFLLMQMKINKQKSHHHQNVMNLKIVQNNFFEN
jgi:hypothetical protein